jgi:hypothetical protein
VTPGGDAVRRGGARLALFVALSLLTRAPFLTIPFLDLDEAAALVGSWTLLDGGILYVDFVDNRPRRCVDLASERLRERGVPGGGVRRADPRRRR